MFNDNAAVINWLAQLQEDGFDVEESIAMIAHALTFHLVNHRQAHQQYSSFTLYDEAVLCFESYLAEYLEEMTGSSPYAIKLPANVTCLLPYIEKHNRE